MPAKQGSQVRRSTPANLSSAGAARDGAGFPDGFCFGVLFRRKAGGSLGQSGRNGSEASFPAEKDRRKCRWRRHVMRTCRWDHNLSTCRVVSNAGGRKFPPADGFKAR
ncbi:hypothetical protein CDO26_34300 (plasmid) [Sinorhizobium meliloti]|nr:hypothetical protein CDO26_34300 [Sinorhizobium meliloti]